MRIVLATKNSNKIREIKDILKLRDAIFLGLDDYPDIPSPVEDGKSYIENATQKARHAARHTGEIALADDSGLEVDILGGKPGIYSARFAGENANDSENRRKLLSLMKDIPEEERGAVFVCVIAIVHPSGEIRIAEGRCAGIIGRSEEGVYGFGYDPIFYPKFQTQTPKDTKTFAELSPSIKNRISHRAKALTKIRPFLIDMLNIHDSKRYSPQGIKI